MKPIIVDLKDISDSTEVYDSKPNRFVPYTIYIICAILAIALIWMYLFRMDIVVKADSVFRGDDDSTAVSCAVTGKITKMSVKDGQYVNEGDELYEVDIENLGSTIEDYKSKLDSVQRRLDMLNAYQKSLDGDNSEFDAMSDNQYYSEFKDRKELLNTSIDAGKEKNKTGEVYDENITVINDSIDKYNEKSGKIKSHKFKIIGSFSGKKQETYTGLSSDFSENMVFVDYSTSQEILNKSENNKIANKILMYSGSAESTDLALNKLKELKIDESKYFVEKDSKAFEESLESVSGIKHIIKIMTYSIMLGGMVVLSLILILWLRERIYEIGIFLSIGTSKIHIIMQFIFELLFISIPSIISSLFLGNVLLKVIVDGFINSEDSMISGGSLINNSSFMLNITTLGQSYLILISIIVLSVVFASSLILIKKPKEILSKIS